MVSKWLWMVLLAFMLGGWCDGCWEQEKAALLQLKPFFSFIWEEGKHGSNCCEWERVECNTSNGRVMRLDLNSKITVDYDDLFYYDYTWRSRNDWSLNASLFLPFEELKSLNLNGNFIVGCVYNEGFERLSSKLDKLEILDLSDNKFNDSILTSLSELSSLKSLNLANNQITGSNSAYGIKRLSKLNNLEILDLSSNMLGNTILSHLDNFTSLKSLSLKYCGLKGIVDMLEFNNLMNLKELYLDENGIESLGSLFQNQGQLRLIKLEVLSLSDNLFNNSIFSSLAALSNLKSLFIASNKLKGVIHIKGIKALSKLNKLEILDLSSNMLGNNILSRLDNLTSLKSLSLKNCGLQGIVDMLEFNNLMNLKELYLDENNIESLGSLFQNKGQLRMIKLELLGLSDNFLNNSIFSSLAALSNLKSLFIESNKLKGVIYIKELNSLSNLEELHMWNNEVNGFVPSQVNETELRLINLEVLDLSGNLFNNSILPSLGRLSKLKSLSFDVNNLEGSIDLRAINSLSNLETLIISCSVREGSTSKDCSLHPKSLAEFPSSLKTLHFRGFSINRTMTTQKLHNFKNLEELWLEDSFLQTNFLRTFGELTSLKSLRLYGCGIINNGSLTPPQEMHNLRNLEELVMEFSFLQSNFLGIFGELTSLKRLGLYDCEINNVGSLTTQGPLQLKNLESLVIEDTPLEYNFLQKMGAMPSLTFLFLWGDGSNGTVNIQGFCEYTSLQELRIINYNVKGNLPECFSNLTSLQVLDLSNNQFSGNISTLKSLTSLRLLSLSNNYFQIPSSLGPFFNLSKLKYIYASNNTIYSETEMHSSTPTFQLNGIKLSCCGDVGSFPQFLYYQHELQYVDLSNIHFKRDQFPNWLLKNNTRLYELNLANASLLGPFQLPLPSHLGLSYLDISNNFLNGSIPVEIGVQLSSLSFLNMSKNNFSGSIPSSFSYMSSLSSLDLSNNALQGKIFSGNFSLSNLWELLLNGNYFSGRIPDILSNSSFLSTLDVSNNQLSGRIPRWMGNMSSLEAITMSNNHLEGAIPMEFCRLDLTLLDLSVNNISGSLPSCFGPSQIRQVHLSKNRLRGTLSDALRNSSVLVTLDVSDNFLFGIIPSWIGGLSDLSYLLLNNNKFEGPIPIELCKLSHLSLIDLSHNKLSGHIPHCLKITTLEDASEDVIYHTTPASLSPSPISSPSSSSSPSPSPSSSPIPFSFNETIEFTAKNVSRSYKGRILPYMSGMDLSWNNLVGEIPYEIGNSRNIIWLSLSHNSLTGPIPPTFANLMRIESLDLSYNNLSGNIPPEFAMLHFLSYFNVSYNNLSGKTPEWSGQLGAFDESSYLGNPFLCGTLVQKNCSPIEVPLTPKASSGNREDDGLIDMGVFHVSFIVSYIIVVLSIVAVLYINPYWRQAWFYHVEMGINSCYYFVIDNLPREFRCGNM